MRPVAIFLLYLIIASTGVVYFVIPLIKMCGCDWFKSRHVV